MLQPDQSAPAVAFSTWFVIVSNTRTLNNTPQCVVRGLLNSNANFAAQKTILKTTKLHLDRGGGSG